jgi:hypothetical protein
VGVCTACHLHEVKHTRPAANTDCACSCVSALFHCAPYCRHIVWDDSDISRFVEARYPAFARVFKGMLHSVERADIFR